MSKTKMDDLAKEVVKTLDDYRDATFEKLQKAVDKAAKDAVKGLKATSPRRHNRYAPSWTSKLDKQTKNWAYKKIVFNKKRYFLTQVLEHGHGSVAARPHIAKVEQEAIDNLVKDIKK